MRAILTYHSIDPSGSPISLDRDAFRRQMAWLATGRVRVMRVADLLAAPPDGDAVALTFDDGCRNLAIEAAPLLAESGFPWTLFVVTDRVGGTNDWTGGRGFNIPELQLLDWKQLGRLAEQGVEIGAHTRTHPRLASLGAAEAADEIEGSAQRITSELGIRPAGFAYPYGELNEAATGAAGRTFDWAVTTELRSLGRSEDAHRLPRLDAFYLREPGRLEAWGSSRFWLYLRWRQGLRRVRAVLPAGILR